jgi:hypothetical protein
MSEQFTLRFRDKVFIIYSVNKEFRMRGAQFENGVLTFWNYLVGEYWYSKLIEHLKTRLPDNLTWEIYLKNRSDWHIDHIIPQSNFNYISNNDDEFKKCWNLRNLRIIDAKTNMKKFEQIDMILVKKYNIIDLLPKGD